jgi:hypothetical protein
VAILLDIADRFEPRLQRALLASFTALQSRYSIAQIEAALIRDGVAGVMRLFEGQLVGGSVLTELEDAVLAGGRATFAMIPAAAVLRPLWQFSLTNPSTSEYLQSYPLDLIRQIDANTREAARTALLSDYLAGRNPRDTARAFRATLGLTSAQEAAVRRYRQNLETLDRRALRRQLRDRRFDPTITRAIRERRPLRPDQIDKMVDRYRDRYRIYRSQSVAQTEALRAVTVGQRASLLQMVADGAVDEGLRRFWVKTNDKRTRDSHRRIPSLNPEGVGLLESYQTPLGPLEYPRDPKGSADNTVRCRCTERFSLAS